MGRENGELVFNSVLEFQFRESKKASGDGCESYTKMPLNCIVK